MLNHIFAAGSNLRLAVTNWLSTGVVDTVGGVPLGTADGTATGEVGAKVLLIGGTAPTPATISATPHWPAVGASATVTIPIGAKTWVVVFILGTGTIGGRNVSVGFSLNSGGFAGYSLATAITVTTAAASDAIIYYET